MNAESGSCFRATDKFFYVYYFYRIIKDIGKAGCLAIASFIIRERQVRINYEYKDSIKKFTAIT